VRTEKQRLAAKGEGSKFVGKWEGYAWSFRQVVKDGKVVGETKVEEDEPSWEVSVAKENGRYRVLLSPGSSAKENGFKKATMLCVYASGTIVAEGKREAFYKFEIPTLKASPDGGLLYTDGNISLRLKKARVDRPPSRLAAEVARIGTSVSADEAAVAAPNRAQVERGLADRWVGSFGRAPKAYLNITVYQGVNALLAKEGLQEMLRGELRADNKLLLTGHIATRGGKVAKYSFDTIQLELSVDGGSLTGVYRDAAGNTGFIAMKKNHEPDRD
jgi:hypothetical protein